MTTTVQSQLRTDLTHAAARLARARAHQRARDSADSRDMVNACIAHIDRLLDMWSEEP